jgi:hypothetical protein
MRRQKIVEGTPLTLYEIRQGETANIRRVIKKFEYIFNRVD